MLALLLAAACWLDRLRAPTRMSLDVADRRAAPCLVTLIWPYCGSPGNFAPKRRLAKPLCVEVSGTQLLTTRRVAHLEARTDAIHSAVTTIQVCSPSGPSQLPVSACSVAACSGASDCAQIDARSHANRAAPHGQAPLRTAHGHATTSARPRPCRKRQSWELSSTFSARD